MPRAYSDDLRCKILQSYDRDEVGLERLATQFGVSYGFTKKIRRQQLQSGQRERPAQRVHGPASRVTEPVKPFLRMQLQHQPDLTLAELGQGLKQNLHLGSARRDSGLSFSGWGWGVKKESLHAQEQDSEEGQQRRQSWWEQITQIDPRRLLFLDESGVTPERTRRYGRARHGERVREGAPAGHWRTLTLLGAITLDGLLAAMTIESPTDGEVFLAYLEQVVWPRLRPGQIVVMDNLSAHKNPQGQRLIEQTGAQVRYLPPYSPDFNPIEPCWAKLKECLRAAKARLLEVLDQAVTSAFAAVTAETAVAWFRNCGYRIQLL